jgi:hypothetical protein
MSPQVLFIDVDGARVAPADPPPSGSHRDLQNVSALPRRTAPGVPAREWAGTGRGRYDHDLIVRLYTAKRLTMQQVATHVAATHARCPRYSERRASPPGGVQPARRNPHRC